MNVVETTCTHSGAMVLVEDAFCPMCDHHYGFFYTEDGKRWDFPALIHRECLEMHGELECTCKARVLIATSPIVDLGYQPDAVIS